MNGLLDVVVLSISLSQKFMSFALSLLIVRLRCDFEELLSLVLVGLSLLVVHKPSQLITLQDQTVASLFLFRESFFNFGFNSWLFFCFAWYLINSLRS